LGKGGWVWVQLRVEFGGMQDATHKKIHIHEFLEKMNKNISEKLQYRCEYE
jgi:hypothetical protein